jgi:hypothetical protein
MMGGKQARSPVRASVKSPFFSPDGRWIGFFAQGMVKKIAVGGAGLQVLTAATERRRSEAMLRMIPDL